MPAAVADKSQHLPGKLPHLAVLWQAAFLHQLLCISTHRAQTGLNLKQHVFKCLFCTYLIKEPTKNIHFMRSYIRYSD
jgi:hypothetical protein